jgi:hypothetical protein
LSKPGKRSIKTRHKKTSSTRPVSPNVKGKPGSGVKMNKRKLNASTSTAGSTARRHGS